MSEDKIPFLKSKRTLIEVAKDVAEKGAEPSLFSQIKEATSVLQEASEFMKNPMFQSVLKEAQKAVEKAFPQQDQNNPFGMSLEEIERLKSAPISAPQAPQSKIPSKTGIAPIVPLSEVHGTLMTVFNEIPENKIHEFLSKYVGSENIEDVRAKIKPFIG